MSQFPAEIGVSTEFKFPSLIQGSGPVSVGKKNGIWTIGHDISRFAVRDPQPDDYILVWDSVHDVFAAVGVETLIGATVVPTAKTQRSVLASPIIISSSDMILNCNIASPATCVLPTSASRAGVPLTFKDLGQATSHNITITLSGAEKADGQSIFVMRSNYQAVTFVPFSDGVNTGWSIE